MAAAPPVRFLLDTHILVAYIRGNPLGHWIEANYSLRTSAVAPVISVVTQGEIRSLARQFGWEEAKLRALNSLIDALVSVPIEFPGIIEAYAEIDDLCRRTGRPMGENDVWIAATARVTRAHLLTTDRDFDHLSNLGFIARDWIHPATRP